MKIIQRSMLVMGLMMSLFAYAQAKSEATDYCQQAGGEVKTMLAQFATNTGLVTGNARYFCRFNIDNGLLTIGLETFSAQQPSIAATLIKRLGYIGEDADLWHGDAANPSHNVCKNLGGTTIGFVVSGGFVDKQGQSDICVFGDGSMVSAWSLIYMANHRTGYDEIKAKVRAEPLNIFISG